MPPSFATGLERYDFLCPSSVLFGIGRFAELGDMATRFGREAWLVTGSRSLEACGGEAAVTALLRTAGLDDSTASPTCGGCRA